MTELTIYPDHLGDDRFYCTDDYKEPLLEYVLPLAEKYRPYNENDYNYGCLITRAYGTFADKYFNGEINKSALPNYLKSKEVIDTITAMGYDIEKFWYLLLFVSDYSYCTCKTGIKLNDSPKEKIKKFADKIIENIESFNPQSSELATFKKPMSISLKIDGKKSYVIKESDSIVSLLSICLKEVENLRTSSHTGFRNNLEDRDPLTKSIHIWYFAKMFLSFFELIPPINTKAKKDSLVSLSKLLLISRLVFVTGLSDNENFYVSEDSLKGFLKQYKDFDIDSMFNLDYF